MSDASPSSRSVRERLGAGAEDRFGRAVSDLLENPLLTGAISRAFDAREKAAQAQEVALGALNLPSAADIERLTRRLRSVSLRLEGIEESLDRLQRALAGGEQRAGSSGDAGALAQRLAAIEDQLARLTDRLERQAKAQGAKGAKGAKPAAGVKRRGKG